ncbi:MAG: mobile mystery protein B [Gemmatimonadaceae bacterium]|nr:mobile mystery protein B [Gemmatimonadaceae bacterium]
MDLYHPEGATPLAPDDMLDLVATHIRTLAELNEWEQTNILRAEEWAFRRKRSVLTESFVKALHRKMFDRTWLWAGAYRKTDTNIGVPWYTIPIAVREACADATTWLERAVFELDEVAVRLHHRMVSIHPFPNGNGRHARLLADVLVAQRGAPRFTWGRTSLQVAGKPRRAYLDALRAADAGSFQPLLGFARS